MKTIRLTMCIKVTLILLFNMQIESMQISRRQDSTQIKHLLQNGRNVVQDTFSLITTGSRKFGTEEKANLLDTTYDDVGQNLVLDLKLTFENLLAKEISNDAQVVKDLQTICNLINQSGITTLTKEMQDDAMMWPLLLSKELFLKLKIELEKVLPDDLKRKIDEWVKQISLLNQKANKIRDEIIKVHKDLDSFLFESFKGFKEGTSLSLDTLRLAWNSDATISGSIEYHSLAMNLNYFLRHIHLLIESEERKYKDEPHKALPIKNNFKETRTYINGLQTMHGLFNGVEAITEHSYDIMPVYFKSIIINKIFEQSNKDMSILEEFSNIDGLKNRAPRNPELELKVATQLKDLWDKSTDNKFRIKIFYDLAQIPWTSDTRSGISPNLITLGERFNSRLSHFDYETANFAGVQFNILFNPDSEIIKNQFSKKLEKAYDPYRNKFEYKFPETILVVGGQDSKIVVKSDIMNSYINATKNWYEATRNSYDPIIGGMSGTTLRSLNLYQAALTKLKEDKRDDLVNNALKITRLRFIMLGFLIGYNKHHSYNEVYMQTHAMPDPSANNMPLTLKTHEIVDGKAKISYHRSYYSDAFFDDKLISGNAKKKLTEFLKQPNYGAEESVFGLLDKLIKKCIPESITLLDSLTKQSIEYVNNNWLEEVELSSAQNSLKKLIQVANDISTKLKSNADCLTKEKLRKK